MTRRRLVRELARIERACYPAGLLEETTPMGELLADAVAYTVLRSAGKVVGYCIAEPDDDGGVYVSDLAILPEARRVTSVWRQLLAWFDEELGGYARVSADCRGTSADITLRLLRRKGYTVSARVVEDYYGGEDVVEVVGRR